MTATPDREVVGDELEPEKERARCRSWLCQARFRRGKKLEWARAAFPTYDEARAWAKQDRFVAWEISRFGMIYARGPDEVSTSEISDRIPA